MVKAYHTTDYDKYMIIKKEGEILPSTRLCQEYSESSIYIYDKFAGDDQFVFLSSPGRIPITSNEVDVYGFVFEAEILILEYKALVGPDLLKKYVELMRVCACDVAEILQQNASGKEGLSVLLDENKIIPDFDASDVIQVISFYQELILQAISTDNTSVLGVSDTIEMFKDNVAKLQKKIRSKGKDALELLKQDPPSWSLDWWEILVKDSLPIKIAIGEIKKGEVMLYK